MVIFSYFGYRIGTTRLDDWKNLLSGHRVRSKKSNTEVIDQKDENYHHYKILVTNILIDGRIMI